MDEADQAVDEAIANVRPPRDRPSRVVLDTNILARSAYSLARTGRRGIGSVQRLPGHTLIASSLLLDEVGRVLRYPRLRRLHGLTGGEIDRFVADVAAAEPAG